MLAPGGGAVEPLSLKHLLDSRNPRILERVPAFARPWFLRLGERLVHLDEIRAFFGDHAGLRGVELLDEIFDHLQVTHALSLRDRQRIPSTGRLVVVANHPLGGLDGLALLRAMSEIRPDVRVVANDFLCSLPGVSEFFLPYDIFSGKPQKDRVEAIGRALEDEEAVIFFPAAVVARMTWHGFREGPWRSGAVRFAMKHGAPILPIFVQASNSRLFSVVSLISRFLSMLLLPHELFNKRGSTLVLTVGDLVPSQALAASTLPPRVLTKLMRRHLLRIGRGRKGIFKTACAIVPPVERKALRAELSRAEVLGTTSDGKRILLVPGSFSTTVKEIARLRELTFRAVGEGTGDRLDRDAYDSYYEHLVLWDESEMEIAGAYRLGPCSEILRQRGTLGLYSASLFKYSPGFEALLPHAVELGRSFVQKRYWNSRALDLLWQGIGAYLAVRPSIRYLFGCVSISATYPAPARDLLVHFYRTWFGSLEPGVRSTNPYPLSRVREAEISLQFPRKDYREELRRLKEALKHYGRAIPTLYKQYADLCEPGGVRFLDFGVDPAFGNCVDGFLLVDVRRITPEKRARYLPALPGGSEAAS
jgi:putative hemolysin